MRNGYDPSYHLRSLQNPVFTVELFLLRRTRSKKLPETLQILKTEWAKGASIRLMFQDGARFGRINDVRRAWAPKPVRPLCTAMLTHEYTYACAAVDVDSGELAR